MSCNGTIQNFTFFSLSYVLFNGLLPISLASVKFGKVLWYCLQIFHSPMFPLQLSIVQLVVQKSNFPEFVLKNVDSQRHQFIMIYFANLLIYYNSQKTRDGRGGEILGGLFTPAAPAVPPSSVVIWSSSGQHLPALRRWHLLLIHNIGRPAVDPSWYQVMGPKVKC